MAFTYLYWHYVLAPAFLARFFWSFEAALLQFFSVPLLLKTLVSHWHKDAVPYKGGTIGAYATAFAWNLISRVIGFIIRGATLAVWLAIQGIYLFMVVVFSVVFLALPLVLLVGFVTGLILLFS
ncbi:MAG: hypothetical protein HYZ63_03060 [Candidatus Andersenbacteria bacterium]|nr:hypothetical protein [Candidatus Andersenbacteria bacterium]